jgi:hypothetical protein
MKDQKRSRMEKKVAKKRGMLATFRNGYQILAKASGRTTEHLASTSDV